MRSSRRTILLATSGALVAGVIGAVPPAQANDGCPYPPALTKLTLNANTQVITAGSPVLLSGRLSRNNCGIIGATLQIQARKIVNRFASGGFTTYATTTTGTNGVYGVAFAPRYNSQIRVFYPGDSGHSPAYSNVVNVYVHIRLRATFARASACRITVSGNTLPTKAFREVRVFSRGDLGHFSGYTFVPFEGASSVYDAPNGRLRTDGRGVFFGVQRLQCDRRYNLTTYMSADSVNLDGISPTQFNVVPRR